MDGDAGMASKGRKKPEEEDVGLVPSTLGLGVGVGVGLGLGAVDSALTTLDPTLLLPRRRAAKDIRVPLPWGHMAGKDWGGASSSEGSRRLLALHGWQDNAGVFDLIVPHLPARWRLVVLDLPGHGFSSPFPRGNLHNHLDFLAAVKRAVTHLGWSTCTMMGHGLGAELAVLYADLFPSEVQQLILLEMESSTEAMDQAQRLLHFLCLEKECARRRNHHSQQEPVFKSYTEAVDHLVEHRAGQLSPWAAQVLLKRGVRLSTSGQGYVDSRPELLRSLPSPTLPAQERSWLLRKIKCRALLVQSGRGADSGADLPSVSRLRVKGTPFALLNDPAQIGAAVASFLDRHGCRL